MIRVQLSERQWSKIEVCLRSECRAGGPAYDDDRKFVEAVLWWRRTGVPWRDLASEFGPWKTVFNRFDRWAKTQHGHHAHEHLLAGLMSCVIEQLQSRVYVQQSPRGSVSITWFAKTRKSSAKW